MPVIVTEELGKTAIQLVHIPTSFTSLSQQIALNWCQAKNYKNVMFRLFRFEILNDNKTDLYINFIYEIVKLTYELRLHGFRLNFQNCLIILIGERDGGAGGGGR